MQSDHYSVWYFQLQMIMNWSVLTSDLKLLEE